MDNTSGTTAIGEEELLVLAPGANANPHGAIARKGRAKMQETVNSPAGSTIHFRALASIKPDNSRLMSATHHRLELNEALLNIGLEESAGGFDESFGPNGPTLFSASTPATYRRTKLLGRGGFGEVWEACQESLGRTVALKMPREAGATAPAESKELLGKSIRLEAQTTACLDHPNIVPIHDLATGENNQPFLAMKLVRGKPWNEIIDSDWKCLSPEEFLARHIPILADVAQAVDFAHSRGVIHRDLKPAQVMIGDYGEVLLMDWGLAVLFDSDSFETAGGRVSGLPVVESSTDPSGTLAFMAPEQAGRDDLKLGVWTDVYLLGGILYLLLTGAYPHQAPTVEAVLLLAKSGLVEPVESATPMGRFVPPELAKLANRALDPVPGNRVPTAKVFLEQLQSWMTGTSQRRESEALANAVGAELQDREPGYDHLTSCDNRLLRALSLWPGNPRAAELAGETLNRHATLALQRGDLSLAELLAGRLGAARGEALLRQVEAARAILRRRESTRKLAVAGVIGLLLGIVALAGFSYVRVTKERDKAFEAEQFARKQAQVAEERRVESEQNLAAAKEQGEAAYALVLFTMDQLRAKLRDHLTPENGVAAEKAVELSHRIAGDIAGQIGEYFESLKTEQWPQELREDQIVRMVTTADKIREMGHMDASVKLTSESLRLYEGLQDPRPQTGMEVYSTLSQCYMDLFLVAGERHWTEQALEYGEKALEIAETKLAEDDPLRLIVMGNHAIALAYAGRRNEGLELSKRSLALRERIHGPNSREVASANMVYGGMLNEAGRYEEALEHYRQAAGLLDDLGETKTPTAVVARINIVDALEKLNRDQESLPLIEVLVPLAEEVLGKWHSHASNSRRKLCLCLCRLGRSSEGIELQRKTVAESEKVNGADIELTWREIRVLALVAQTAGDFTLSAEEFLRAAAISAQRLGEGNSRHLFELTMAMEMFLSANNLTQAMKQDARLHDYLSRADASIRLRIPPDVLKLELRAARQYAANGDHPAARQIREQFMKHLDEYGDEPWDQQQGFKHILLTDALLGLDRTEEAAAAANHAVSLGIPNSLAEEERNNFEENCKSLGIELPPKAQDQIQ